MPSQLEQPQTEGSADPSEESSIVAVGTGQHAVAEVTSALTEGSHTHTLTAAQPVPGERIAWTIGSRFWALNLSHIIIDVYPIFFASLMLVFKERLGLTAWQMVAIFATGPIVSGLPQVFFAWVTDRLDSRICGWFGLSLGAMCICSIGYASNFWVLWGLQIAGMLGTGMYHPIGAALAGQIGGAIKPPGTGGRAWGVGMFYTAGMVGGFLGSLLCTRMTAAFGPQSLLLLAVPGLFMAAALYSATSRFPHRHVNHHELHNSIAPDESRERRFAVGLLFVGNVMRFTVNTGLPVLFVIWAERRLPTDVASATNLNGNLLAALAVGMGIFGLTARRWSPVGREKGPMLALTLIGAVIVGATGFAGTSLGEGVMYLMVAASAMGFSAVIPTTISIAQRLLPGRTGLASGLMLGTAWSVSAVAPALAQLFFGGVNLANAPELDPWRIDLAFVGFALLLVVSALLTWAIPADLLKRIGHHH